jgi:replicative DNA helicase
MGKTALATNIAFNIAKAYRSRSNPDGSHETINGGIVGFFSLEMSSEQLATRIIAEQAGVPPTRSAAATSPSRSSTRSSSRRRRTCRRSRSTSTTRAASASPSLSRARRLKRQRGLDLLVVDYLQLLSGSKSKGDNRVQELSEITTGLKALAKELNVPVMALSQLSRQVERATTSGRSSRTCANPARSSRTPTW